MRLLVFCWRVVRLLFVFIFVLAMGPVFIVHLTLVGLGMECAFVVASFKFGYDEGMKCYPKCIKWFLALFDTAF